MLTTYADLIYHVLDYYGADATVEGRRQARRAVQSAYSEVANCHRWSYLLNRGRITTSAQQTTGTVAYDHTGGLYERMLTLTGATWPSWAALGVVLTGNISYEIATRVSDTVVTLSIHNNPGADVASGTSYTLYREGYALPTDFQEAGDVICLESTFALRYLAPTEWMRLQRVRWGPGTTYYYTIFGDPNYYAGLSMRFFPPPATQQNIDFLYKRLPRTLTVDEVTTGTATLSNGDVTVTGTGTAWTSNMVGSVLRFAANGSSNPPTGPGGAYPAAAERVITAVASNTSLTVDNALADTFTGVPYAISDPVDIEAAAMNVFLLRECERQARLVRRMKPSEGEQAEWEKAMWGARETDARTFEKRSAGQGHQYPVLLRHLPINFTSS